MLGNIFAFGTNSIIRNMPNVELVRSIFIYYLTNTKTNTNIYFDRAQF